MIGVIVIFSQFLPPFLPSGIGLGTVRVLTKAGYDVCGSVRRPADGERLMTEFGASFTPLLFDVTDQAAVKNAADKVPCNPALGPVLLAVL